MPRRTAARQAQRRKSPSVSARAGPIWSGRAFWLEHATVGWIAIEAAVAVSSGIQAGSVSVLAFGIDSVIELASALVLIWRPTVELRQGQVFADSAERTASRIAASNLLLFGFDLPP